MLSLDQVHALSSLAGAVRSYADYSVRPLPDFIERARLGSIAAYLDRCDALDIDPDQTHAIADAAGITPADIDRLTDADVRAYADRMGPILYPNTACAVCGRAATYRLIEPTDATPLDSIGAPYCADCTRSTCAGFAPLDDPDAARRADAAYRSLTGQS